MKDSNDCESFNLIVHGLCAFVERDRHIDIIFPNMPEHTYAAGLWKKETMLQQGETYRLLGVNPEDDLPADCGPCSISQADSNISAIDPNGGGFCTLWVPKPIDLKPLRSLCPQTPPSTDFFVGEGVDQNDLHPNAIPVVYGLKYTIANLKELALSDFWRPDLADETKDPINLHIWAEPACNTPGHHVSEGFRCLVDMLPELDLAIHPQLDVEMDLQFDRYFPDVDQKERAVLRERCQVQPVGSLDVTKVRNCIGIVVKGKSS